MKLRSIILLLMVVLLSLPSVYAETYEEMEYVAEAVDVEIEPFRADPVVTAYTIYPDSTNTVEFMLSVKQRATKIQVTSVSVQKDGGSWASLTPPSTIMSGTYFEAFKQYSFASGSTYIIRATFSIDGYLYTGYSAQFTR